MVVFKNENQEIGYPYDRDVYFSYLDDDLPSVKWYGYSLQIQLDFSQNISYDLLKSVFQKIIIENDTGDEWLVNHDDKHMPWFFDKKDNLPLLRSLFEGNGILNSFKGVLSCFKEDVIFLAKDLVSYPFLLSYKNIDISHSKQVLILKLTSHLTIDVLSTDEEKIQEIISYDFLQGFKKVKYRD